jgi:hypothetical protein
VIALVGGRVSVLGTHKLAHGMPHAYDVADIIAGPRDYE